MPILRVVRPSIKKYARLRLVWPSVMVGDRLSDVAAGLAAGCETILVRCGAHATPPIVGMGEHPDVHPARVCRDLASAVSSIELGPPA